MPQSFLLPSKHLCGNVHMSLSSQALFPSLNWPLSLLNKSLHFLWRLDHKLLPTEHLPLQSLNPERSQSSGTWPTDIQICVRSSCRMNVHIFIIPLLLMGFKTVWIMSCNLSFFNQVNEMSNFNLNLDPYYMRKITVISNSRSTFQE